MSSAGGRRDPRLRAGCGRGRPRRAGRYAAHRRGVRRKPAVGRDFKQAANAGLRPNAPAFMRYRDMRNSAPHTCNAERAEEAAAAMDEFLRDARFLLAALRGRDNATD